MEDLIKESINNPFAALEVRKLILNKLNKNKLREEDIIKVIDILDNLTLDDLIKLGNNFRKFPMGCDLVDLAIGPCSSSLTLNELIENCVLSDYLGFPIHICGYAIADIAENSGLKPIEVFKKILDYVEVPIDIDHFGRFGPMRFPKEITHCLGDCYNLGLAKECPRGRIYRRLIDKEMENKDEFIEWIKLSSTVCINVVEEQDREKHGASIDEMKEVAKAAKTFGKGVEGIFHIGDGYDDLIVGIKACVDLDVDVFVVEGGPFNLGKDRLKNYAKAVVASRILVKGGVVGTNGAYENELRIGLRAGLNTVVTGFPFNHHGYMCGYSPGTAKRGNFGLRRVMRIIKEESCKLMDKNVVKAIALSGNFLNKEVYPERLGEFYIGDAHWRAILESKLRKLKPKKSIDDIKEERVGLIGGRYVAWKIAERVEEVYISDKDEFVEKATIKILNENNINAYPCNGDDKKALSVGKAYITSFIPELALKILSKYKEAETLI
ncbi:5,10-methenyltetrahydromethanopterin hydrogenase cofactor biosynthesis protein HmdC [Methanocaldococcus sp.]